MAEPKQDVRYDAQAIDFMESQTDRFYEIWLELATEHATQSGRRKVLKEDADATLIATLNRLREPVNDDREPRKAGGNG